MPAVQSRSWSWTLNNPTQAEKDHVQSLFADGKVSYIIYGEEIAPETGTPHLQGYVEIAKKLSLGGMKRLIANRIHLERSMGNASQNIMYCKKIRPQDLLPNAVVYEAGVPRRQSLHGNNGYDRLNEQLLAGATLLEIQSENPSLYCRMHRGIDRFIQNMNSVPRNFMSKIVIYQGTTRTGKSFRAHFFDVSTWTHAGDRWFDGYQGHDTILFDDFEGIKSGIPYRKFLQLCDAYPVQVPTKGGFANFRPRKIIFTTNVDPSMWYPDESYDPVRERIFTHLLFGPAWGQFTVLRGEVEEGPRIKSPLD